MPCYGISMGGAFQTPRAGVEISGSGPNLQYELAAPSKNMVVPIRICSIIAHFQAISFLHSLRTGTGCSRHDDHAATANPGFL